MNAGLAPSVTRARKSSTVPSATTVGVNAQVRGDVGLLAVQICVHVLARCGERSKTMFLTPVPAPSANVADRLVAAEIVAPGLASVTVGAVLSTVPVRIVVLVPMLAALSRARAWKL